MSWADIFPLLGNDMVASYENEATEAEKNRLEHLFSVDKVFNRRVSSHVAATSLFWKPAWSEEDTYPTPTRDLMENPIKAGLSSRFRNPWEHYVETLLKAGTLLKEERPDVTLRVYLAQDLSFAIDDLVNSECEIFLMKSSSLRASPGSMWRFLAMEEGCLATMTDSDQAGHLLANIQRTELMAQGGLKYWRLPYFPGPGELNHGNPGWYRTTNACSLGASLKLPVKLLAESLLWNLEKGKIDNCCNVGGRKIPIWGGKWPDYCFDEYFLNSAIFPRAAEEGILTLLPRRDTSQNYWFALDIEHCMKANPDSEIMHWGKPWRTDIPDFSWSKQDVQRIQSKLRSSDETRPLVSVCVCVKNRSRLDTEEGVKTPFPNCVRALSKIHQSAGPIELVVADFASDDWPLKEWLDENLNGMTCQVLPLEGDFSKGRGINETVRSARSDNILLYDADMVIDQSAFITGLSILAKQTSFFPIVENLDPDGNPNGWHEDGLGMAFLTKKVFEAAGGVPEFHSWGGEDDLLFENVARVSPVERFKLRGLQHQWHPVSCRHENYLGARWEDFRAYRKEQENKE